MTDLKLTKEEQQSMWTLFWRQNFICTTLNWVRQQGLDVVWILQPLLRKIYKSDDAGYWEAMKRHSAFFNTTPQMAPFIFGLVLSMEEENTRKDTDFDPMAINGIKIGLMGPLAGIGDSFFQGTLRIIATGIGIGLAAQGNILGPLLYLFVYNIPGFLLRYYGAIVGYKLGAGYLQEAMSSGMFASVTKAASMMGLIMIGAMTAQMVTFQFTWSPEISGQALHIQQILDSILPGMIPLFLTFLCFYWLRNKVDPIKIIIGILAFAFVCGAAGIA